MKFQIYQNGRGAYFVKYTPKSGITRPLQNVIRVGRSSRAVEEFKTFEQAREAILKFVERKEREEQTLVWELNYE